MPDFEQIDCDTLKSWMDSGDVILVDVREIEEYQEAYIPRSILIPLNTLHGQTLPQNPDKKLVFHCKAGIRSDMACQQCMDFRSDTLYSLTGGIQDWIAKGYPIKQS